MARGNNAGGGLQLQRQAEILGEMIESPQRQDAERHLRAREHARRGADRAIAARHGERALLAGLARPGGNELARRVGDCRAGQGAHRGVRAVLHEGRLHPSDDVFAAGNRSGGAVYENEDFHEAASLHQQARARTALASMF